MSPVSPTFAAIVRKHLAGRSALTWEEFTQLALYHPKVGYYSRPVGRVGRSADTDFYTSYSLGPLFAQLLTASFRSLIGNGDLNHYTLVEIGAEPEQSLFDPVADQFAAVRTIRRNDVPAIQGPCILFSNELLDAQPFHRFIYDVDKGWQLCGVRLSANNQLEDCLIEKVAPEVQKLMHQLPTDLPQGYRIDLSLQAEQLFASYLDLPWHGLLVFLDYGATWHELTTSTPQGSARAYSRHRQSPRLLDNPGEQDLTCHVCWDRLLSIAKARGIAAEVIRQEAFFMRYAIDLIGTIIGSKPEQFNTERRTLQELLHPAYLGQRFQALHLIQPDRSH